MPRRPPATSRARGKIVERQVKGALFVDYVRMIRAHKTVDWARHLSVEDRKFLEVRIEPQVWYPMQTFERMGLAILDELGRSDPLSAQAWGRYSTELLAREHPDLLVPDDPRESLMRFQVMRGSFFDFPAVSVGEITDHAARIEIQYGMGPRAEQAACHQTLGFFLQLLKLVGADNPRAAFEARSWEGDAATVVALSWTL
jgi:hypothetical protein